MSDSYRNEPMLDMFLFETSQLIEQLEQSILESEKQSFISEANINEIFRIMHTIKGSAAMMLYNEISTLAHTIEDLFYFLREEKPKKIDFTSLCDPLLEGIDFIKIEIEKIKNSNNADGNSTLLKVKINELLIALKEENNSNTPPKTPVPKDEKKQYYISQNKEQTTFYRNAYKAVVFFEDECEMENIRAYTIIHNLKEFTNEFYYIPEDILENDESIDVIRHDGFRIYLKSDYSYEDMDEFFNKTIFLKDLELTKLESIDEFEQFSANNKVKVQDNSIKMPVVKDTYYSGTEKIERADSNDKNHVSGQAAQSIISVSVSKLDKLMDLVGEMVISEAMVIQNPELKGLELDNFYKAARQLNKITSEMQDMVMSIRMVPLLATFQKMNRIVRDMSKKLQKEVKLELIGEDTEVDKNIIEHISDPLMHLVRNSLDHGIETSEERLSKGKPKEGTITLEAKNVGSDVLIIVKDDGKGLDKEKIFKKASEHGLIYKSQEDMSEKEIFNLILLPGFSTNDSVTEYSGRGVGMDVVAKNIETIGGTLSVDSEKDKGSIITLKIPLTLAIIDGMNLKVGNSGYTLPTISIKESFRPKAGDIITDPDNNEMIMVRGQCYPILRLHKLFNVDTKITNFTEGILIMVEQDEKMICIFADALLGQQQVVVKTMPKFIQKYKKIEGITGCTLLGDGSISLILNVGGLINQ